MTNFAVESIEQVFNGTPNFGSRVQATVSRNGDLINQVFLVVELPALSTEYVNIPDPENNDLQELSYTNSIGHAIIREVSVDIGGQEIDKQYGEWLEIENPMSLIVIC